MSKPPPGIHKRMRHYCGSAMSDTSGRWFGVSSPRGNIITFWDAQSGGYADHTVVTDGCGIAPGYGAGEFFISSGQGTLLYYRLGDGQGKRMRAVGPLQGHWDNHMSRLKL